MSDNNHATVDEGAPAGLIKTPKQLLITVFLAFVIPIFGIVGIVQYVTSGDKSGVGDMYTERAVMARIQKVGSVQFGSGERSAKTGEEVFKVQCSACHSAGLVGAPKFGDAAVWAPRIKTGFEALLSSALKGKNAMTPQGGGAFDALEIGRAVVYMANAAGAKFEEPKTPAASAPAVAASASK